MPPKNQSLKTYPADYSNTGFALLGLVLSRASKTRFPELLEKAVLSPLGMKDTSFKLNSSQQRRFIDGYDANKLKTPHWDFEVFAPTGGLRSTLSDMKVFAKANLYPTSSLLSQAIQLSQKNNWGWDSELFGIKFPYKNGGTGGFSSAFLIEPSRQLAAVILTNIAVEADSFAVTVIKAIEPKATSRIISCGRFY